jgi:hypothetical protein
MKIRDAVICWNAPSMGGDGRVAVFDHVAGLSLTPKARPWRGYRLMYGHSDSEWRESTDADLVLRLFLEFHVLVVRDGIDPQKAHKAFSALDAYRMRISPDIKVSP